MSTQRPKDGLLASASDPVQSSILRHSATGWGKSSITNSSSATTPLRIAKREGKSPFPPVARRSSSSYRHVKNSNLVSKSPFKIQSSTPSRPSTSTHSDTHQGTRRVSGEKRPRPDSMHEQAENERPLAFKRERRQSQVYQGLMEKEPVTKSPFKRVASAEEEQPPPLPPKAAITPAPTPPVAPPSPPSSAPPSRPVTPSRSSLVSKRLHGPRAADQSLSDGRRQRRKTVTFDERCDVLEFDRDEEEHPFLSSDEDDYGQPEQHDEPEAQHFDNHDHISNDDAVEQLSFENVDVDQSIMQGLRLPSTPTRHPSLPADMETEDGVPYGRSHHAERARRRASVSSPALSSPAVPFYDPDHAEQDPPTPLRTMDTSLETSFGSEVLLDSSAHVERAHQDHVEVEAGTSIMPPSPSPTEKPIPSTHHNRDPLVPCFELQPPEHESSPKGSQSTLSTADVFTASMMKEDAGEMSFASNDDSLDPANLSIGQSEVSLSNLELEAELQARLSDLIPRSAPFSTSTPPPTLAPQRSSGSPMGLDMLQQTDSSLDLPGSPALRSASVPDSDVSSTATDVNSPLIQPSPSTIEPQPTSADTLPSFSLVETSFDLSGNLGMGFRDSVGSIQLGEMKSALDRLMDDVNGSSGSSTKKPNAHSQVRAELLIEGIKPGQFSANTSSNGADDSMQTETDMDLSMDDFRGAPIVQPAPLPIQRAATDSIVYTGPAFRSPVDEAPVPASPTKDAIKERERLILEKRRQARRRDIEESMDYYTPPRPTSVPPSAGRPSRRRSRSTGDAGVLTKSDLLLDIGISDTEEEFLADSISKELRRLDPEHRQGKYRVREHEAIFASGDAEQVSHTSFAGDVNSGKAWKAVRRPSDMNEFAKQIKEYRSQEKPGKAHGKVFVRVLGVKGLKVPIPQHATALTCTLNNGIHFVTTPETRLSSDARIDQEFELIEHNKLEFTLTLKIRRDPHIVAQFKALVPPAPPPPVPAPPPPAPPPKSKGGMFSFLSSSPKKPVPRAAPPPPPPPPAAPPHKFPDNLARYLKQDGTLARAFISFRDIAARCDVRLLEVKYPLIGQRCEASGGAKTMELGEIVLQMFRLPSLPGVTPSQLPLSLDECLRGLRHVAWHKVTYFEGTLTQNGGDCTSWRRRMFRVTGANLIAFNDVTKKATATINLKKAIAVEDTHDARSAALSPGGRHRDDYDSLIAVERSFRLVFPSEQEILFFADSEAEKAKWLEVLRALVGHIPPNPFWAELIWQRQQEMAVQSQPSHATS